ncbi:hypothetical protein H6G96_37450 [Nostoc sp. FACHB-892]|uniref:hypothetical protein n=1 Tax=Nostoc sp. FACHB-892 TaxID=2692843 RepID=UPI0016899E2D|nr:hypothetical protein [Nostoc sp. FACHB-892]MBD2731811.1 hypothetical protein [Nostoc sp. FACHB-892]
MKPLDKYELREMRQKFKSEKVRSLSPLFSQIIQIARDELFNDEEISIAFAEGLSNSKGDQYLVGALLGAAYLSKNREQHQKLISADKNNEE